MAVHPLQLLLPTKLAAPQPLAAWIPRTRLLSRLGPTPHSRLTLIVAPAGFGKSTLLAQWLLHAEHRTPNAELPETSGAAQPRRVAWLTLDEHDQDVSRFLAYVVGAIERAVPEVLSTTLSLLAAPEPPPPYVVIQTLLVDLRALPTGLILVLDDYHYVSSESIHQTVAYLLRHLPPNCRLVMLSRVNPPLPLVRLRAERAVTELGAADLRFTETETDALLTSLLGAAASPTLAMALYQYTEGWALGLQLAALAQLNSSAPNHSLGLVTREITQYLADEVLAHQPPAIQQTLLVLALPERFCAGLCAALLGSPDDLIAAENQIEQITRANLFLIPLDNQGCWYRFHHLFRELLLRRLHLTLGQDGVRELLLRAAQWLAAEVLVEEAVRLFLLAGATTAAGDLVEQQILDELNKQGSNARLAYWLRLLPAGQIRCRPGLALIEAHLAAVNLDLPVLEASLERVESLLAAHTAANYALPWPTFLIDLAALRGTLHCWQGRPAEASDYLRSVLAQGTIRGFFVRALILLGLANVGLGQYNQSMRQLELSAGEQLAVLQPGQWVERVVARCGMHLLAGELAPLADDARLLAEMVDGSQIHDATAGYLDSCLGVAAYERSDLSAATGYFGAVVRRKYRVNHATYVNGVIGLALIAAAQGAADDAAAYQQEVLAVATEAGGIFFQHQALGCAIRLALARGDRVAATLAAERIASDIHLGLSPWLETPRLSQVRALIAAADKVSLARADALLDACLAEVEPLHNLRLLIAGLALRALLYQAQARPDEALAALARAVELARPRRFVRTFVDLGPALVSLLQALVARDRAADYSRQLLAAFEAAGTPVAQPLSASPHPPMAALLTPREAQILALLAQRWSDKEIAAQLVITSNTVRRHTSTIYGKLGVGSRREAVAVAQAIGLLSSA